MMDINNSNYDGFSIDDFDSIISKFNLKPNFELSMDGDAIIVTETWSSNRNSVVADRIYEFDLDFIETIPTDIKKRLLEGILNIYVESEKYEDAAIIRDIILDIE